MTVGKKNQKQQKKKQVVDLAGKISGHETKRAYGGAAAASGSRMRERLIPFPCMRAGMRSCGEVRRPTYGVMMRRPVERTGTEREIKKRVLRPAGLNASPPPQITSSCHSRSESRTRT